MAGMTEQLTRHGTVDQIVYRWSPRSLTGKRGVGPVATSLDADALRVWDGRLGKLVWATGDDEETRPEQGFVFFAAGEQYGLLRKIPVADDEGRAGSTLAHVLICRALTTPEALGLTYWEDWTGDAAELPEDGVLPALDGPELGRWAEYGLYQLRERVAQLPPEALTRLLGAVLENPVDDLTVTAAGAAPLELVCALADILGEAPGRPWTFATHESADTAADLPRVVFLAGNQFSTRGSARRRVRLDTAAVAPAAASPVVAAIVTRYLRSGVDGVARLRPPEPLSGPKSVAAWAKGIQYAPGVLADAADLLRRMIDGGLTETELQVVVSGRIDEHLVAAVGRLPDSTLVRAAGTHAGTKTAQDLARRAVHELAVRVATGRLAPETRLDETGLVFDERLIVSVLGQEGLLPTGTAGLAGFLRAVGRFGGLSHGGKLALTHGVEEIPAANLLHWLDRTDDIDPAIATHVLAVLTERKQSSRDRRDALDVFLNRHGLVQAVTRLAPVDQEPAVRHFAALVEIALGKSATRARTMAEVLERLGPEPAPALLRALWRAASRGRARRLVEQRIATLYFRSNDVAGPPAAGRRTW
ncbi:hypothetical protein CF165_11265 [Amycolatopsis vastitatis]|uniref:Uncharacterized protein n=2 Tax=Amycolatopsis vastitatis TaxID=1905142 RepID=A0A229TC19_9PSEU|nr:hypothetical protein CF165_11265 [Amycolatopsis vastitatis]